jgi:hypothetical protein
LRDVLPRDSMGKVPKLRARRRHPKLKAQLHRKVPRPAPQLGERPESTCQ